MMANVSMLSTRVNQLAHGWLHFHGIDPILPVRAMVNLLLAEPWVA